MSALIFILNIVFCMIALAMSYSNNFTHRFKVDNKYDDYTVGRKIRFVRVSCVVVSALSCLGLLLVVY